METEQTAFHDCPSCGYRATDAEFLAARFDYRCPRCGKSSLSEFHLVQQAVEEQE